MNDVERYTRAVIEWIDERLQLNGTAVAEYDSAQRPHVHVHQWRRGDDSCYRCGRDLRDDIHLRVRP
jgi:hypothetical protein